MIAILKSTEVSMGIDIEIEESNVDHFLISTRENQFLLIFIDKLATTKMALNIWEE